MNEPRALVSPKENIAEQAVLSVQEAQSQIKSLIVRSYYEGWPKTKLESEIGKVIAKTSEGYPERYRDEIRRSLAINSQKWHYLYMNNVKITNIELIKSIKSLNKTYSIDIATLAGMDPSQTKAVVDRFRPLLTQDKIGSQLIADYEKSVKRQIVTLASDPANMNRIDKNGKPYRISLRNFAEMEVRYEANLQDVAKLKEEGVKLVMASSHADASLRCAPYQGKLYSLDGSSGKTADGRTYTPLDEALQGPRGDGNGIINGYNCRHRLIEYTPGMRTPREYDRNTIRKENAITIRQREYERKIRNLKLEENLYKTSGEKEAAAQINNQWKRLENNYRAFSLKNNRPFFEWRTKVTESEKSTY